MAKININFSSENGISNTAGSLAANGLNNYTITKPEGKLHISGNNSYALIPVGAVSSFDDRFLTATNTYNIPTLVEVNNAINADVNNVYNTLQGYVTSEDLTSAVYQDAISQQVLSSAAVTQWQGTVATKDSAASVVSLLATANVDGNPVASGFRTGAGVDGSGDEYSFFDIAAENFRVFGALQEWDDVTGEWFTPTNSEFTTATDSVGDPIPIFAIRQDPTNPALNGIYFNGKVTIDAIPTEINKDIGSFASEAAVNQYLLDNPLISIGSGDTYTNTTDGRVYIWNGSAWANTKGEDGEDGDRGGTIGRYTASAWPSTSTLDSIIQDLSGTNPIKGDQVIATKTNSPEQADDGTRIYAHNGTSWTDDTDLTINGSVVVKNTLFADKLASSSLLLTTSTTGGANYVGTNTPANWDSTGFFMGYESGTPKMHIGNSTNYLQWNGSTMVMKGYGNFITPLSGSRTSSSLQALNLSGGVAGFFESSGTASKPVVEVFNASTGSSPGMVIYQTGAGYGGVDSNNSGLVVIGSGSSFPAARLYGDVTMTNGNFSLTGNSTINGSSTVTGDVRANGNRVYLGTSGCYLYSADYPGIGSTLYVHTSNGVDFAVTGV